MTIGEDHNPGESKKRLPLWAILIALIVGSVPCQLTGVLMAINLDYMAQLALGPPVGAFIPGSHIPMGWPIIAVILLLVLIGLGANLLLVRIALSDAPSGLIIAACLFVSISVQFVNIWLIILGPSAVQLYKAFYEAGM